MDGRERKRDVGHFRDIKGSVIDGKRERERGRESIMNLIDVMIRPGCT